MILGGTSPRPKARRVAILIYPGVDAQDVVGPHEVFAAANAYAHECGFPKGDLYEVTLAGVGEDRRVRSCGGLVLEADRRYTEGAEGLDTLLVAGGLPDEVIQDAALLRWLRHIAPQVRRLGSVCTGAFVLAAAGLLDGRRAVTHWRHCDRFARQFPRVRLDADPIFIRDGHIYTSAGVTAGMDLALALVEEDAGRALALRVARELVMFVRRPGGQSQFSPLLVQQAADEETLSDLLAWMAAHLREDLSVERLAERANMSARNFSRVFRRRLSRTPARFVEHLRVEAARRRLEESEAGLERVAQECGFGSADSMRRSFLRVLRVAPSDYRAHFPPAMIEPA
ncbi:MAG: GlxA family transcriptional regulator [Armatimonadetes bacterium]|nr:GlxA family transcriptional regulator [Armatimonadota bacterium]